MKNDNKSSATPLRQKAEELVKIKLSGVEQQSVNSDSMTLIHEPQVHHIELEIQNEELLRAKEEAERARTKLAELYDFAPVGYFTLSKEGEIVQLNLCASQMLGKGRALLIKSRLGFFVSDDTKQIFNMFLDRIFKLRTKGNCEVTFSGDDDEPIAVQLDGVISENGEHCLVTAVDISERKETELALVESKELYTELVANQVAGIYRLRVQKPESGKSPFDLSSLDFVSDRFCELFEVENSGDLSEIFSKCIGKIHPDNVTEFIHQIDSALINRKPFQFDIQLLGESGAKWLRSETNPRVLSDGTSRWTGIVLDITEHKVTENEIRISEMKYRKLLELASDAFFHGDYVGDFITVNSVATELTGYSKDELLKMNMKDLFSSETLVGQPLKYEQARKGDITITERELLRKDGSVIIVDMKSRMMPDGTFQSFFRDITERKRIEKALKQKLNEMEIYYELAITRERKMIALKSEINMLLERLGEPLKY